jgi:glyoxylase I family protein
MAGNNQAIGGGGFHHVSFQVRDIEASLKFYVEGLGFVPKLSWGQGEKRTVLLDTGDGNYFEISGGGSDAPNGRPLSALEGIFRHVALRTTDVDKATERARAAGAEITIEPKDVMLPSDPPTPVRIAFFKGPDGEIIEYFQNKAT